jgi:hypothetical protein
MEVEKLTVEQLELLETHKPLLCFDRQYDFRPVAVEGAFENAGNLLCTRYGEAIAGVGASPALSLAALSEYPEGLLAGKRDALQLAPNLVADSRAMELDQRLGGRLYGRVVEDGGRTWLQYWFWLYYNPKNLFGFGSHEGDWEMVQIGLDARGRPELATYAQHGSGEARRFGRDRIDTRGLDGRAHPVVYVAPLSHASYFEDHAHPYLLGLDNPAGGGPDPWLPVEAFGPWAHWEGHWGRSDRGIPGILRKGPRGPAHQNPKWASPETFHRRMRRRKPRALLGRLMRLLGRPTYPRPPRLEAAVDGSVCRVRFALDQAGARRSRHLHVTVHDAERRVLAARVIRRADRLQDRERTVVLHLPERPAPDSVCGSTYNRLRQRSDVAETPLAEAAAATEADRGRGEVPG